MRSIQRRLTDLERTLPVALSLDHFSAQVAERIRRARVTFEEATQSLLMTVHDEFLERMINDQRQAMFGDDVAASEMYERQVLGLLPDANLSLEMNHCESALAHQRRRA